MTSTTKGIVLRFLFFAAGLLLGLPAVTLASACSEPLLLVYPDAPAVFRYDTSRYELISPTDPKFNALYAVGSEMLWDKQEQRVPVEIYRAPDLVGFEPSPLGTDEYVVLSNNFSVIVDGFTTSPRTFSNLYMRFIPSPSNAFAEIQLDGTALTEQWTSIPSLSVSTAIGDGFYSDTVSYQVSWRGATGMRIVVYSDKNNDQLYSGGKPLYSIYAEDNTLPVQSTTWGKLKAQFRQ